MGNGCRPQEEARTACSYIVHVRMSMCVLPQPPCPPLSMHAQINHLGHSSATGRLPQHRLSHSLGHLVHLAHQQLVSEGPEHHHPKRDPAHRLVSRGGWAKAGGMPLQACTLHSLATTALYSLRLHGCPAVCFPCCLLSSACDNSSQRPSVVPADHGQCKRPLNGSCPHL